MATLSEPIRVQMLRSIFTPDTFTAPAPTVMVALCSEVPLSNSSVEELVEPSTDDGYARQVYPLSSAYWEETGFGELYNSAEIVFPIVMLTWGSIAGWAMIDVLANEIVASGDLLNPFIASEGIAPTLESGTITFGLYEE